MPNFNCRVSGILLNDNKEVLIIKRNKNYLTNNQDNDEFIGWEFCGGGIEHDESPENAIIREYKEEVGITISVSSIFDSRTGRRDGKPLINISYVCKYLSGEIKLTKEHTEHQWVQIKNLKSYNMGSHVNNDRDKFIELCQKT